MKIEVRLPLFFEADMSLGVLDWYPERVRVRCFKAARQPRISNTGVQDASKSTY
jgi:hypothetical protein